MPFSCGTGQKEEVLSWYDVQKKGTDMKKSGNTWPVDRVTFARNMRQWRWQWSTLPLHHRHQLEAYVYTLRGRQVSEEEIARAVKLAIDIRCPWRLSDRQLARYWKAMQADSF